MDAWINKHVDGGKCWHKCEKAAIQMSAYARVSTCKLHKSNSIYYDMFSTVDKNMSHSLTYTYTNWHNKYTYKCY